MAANEKSDTSRDQPPSQPPVGRVASSARSDSERPESDAPGKIDQTETDDPQKEASAPLEPHTAAKCLALIARHHELDVSADRLIHDYSLEDRAPDLRRVLRMAKDVGLKSRHARLTWQQLTRLDQAFPVMLRLKNGNYCIAVGMRKSEGEDGKPVDQIAIFDPLADQQGFVYVEQAKLEKSWQGEAILAKRTFSLLDSKQPFSLTWFLPEVFRQRTAFMDVAVAALFIHLIALVVPLFFQIVIDKVLTNYAIATLHVLTVGICFALLFDAALGYLRSFLLLHATSKIDIRVATRTFGHMLKLPMPFLRSYFCRCVDQAHAANQSDS